MTYDIAADVVSTTDVSVVMPHVAVIRASLLQPNPTVGATDDAQKPEGYVSVMVLLEITYIYAVDARVIDTEGLTAIRSDDAMSNAIEVT